jgi:hypothetical protein
MVQRFAVARFHIPDIKMDLRYIGDIGIGRLVHHDQRIVNLKPRMLQLAGVLSVFLDDFRPKDLGGKFDQGIGICDRKIGRYCSDPRGGCVFYRHLADLS